MCGTHRAYAPTRLLRAIPGTDLSYAVIRLCDALSCTDPAYAATRLEHLQKGLGGGHVGGGGTWRGEVTCDAMPGTDIGYAVRCLVLT
eukprot:458184-Rhodomonas_salina.1